MESRSVGDVVKTILKVCGEDNVRAIILYGSAARGEAREASDIGILVLVDKPCSLTIEPPYAVVVNTLDEWSKLRQEFRMEILRDGVLLYAKNIGVRRILNARPWLLVKYSGREPRIRQCIKNSLNKLLKKMSVEKVAPGVILAPYGMVSSKVIETILSCGGDINTRFIAYKEVDVYYAVCPYCGFVVAGNKKYVEKEMKKHLLNNHTGRLEEIAEKMLANGKSVPGGNIRGLAGWITSYIIRKE